MVNVRRIEGRLKEMGFTHQAFAEKIDVSRRTFATVLETGRITKEKYLHKMAQVLDVEPSYLLAEPDGTNTFHIQQGERSSYQTHGENSHVQTGNVYQGGRSLTDELVRLAELREKNLLTEEEFILAKRRLLTQ